MEVKIRPLVEDDARTSFRWRNDPEIWKYTGSSPDREITLVDEIQWIKKAIADPSSYRFAILADNVYVGNVYLTGVDEKRGEYHIFLGEKSYAGKGIAREASKRIIQFGKDVLKLEEIRLEVKPENARAVGLYESLGFVAIKTDERKIEMSINLRELDEEWGE